MGDEPLKSAADRVYWHFEKLRGKWRLREVGHRPGHDACLSEGDPGGFGQSAQRAAQDNHDTSNCRRHLRDGRTQPRGRPPGPAWLPTQAVGRKRHARPSTAGMPSKERHANIAGTSTAGILKSRAYGSLSPGLRRRRPGQRGLLRQPRPGPVRRTGAAATDRLGEGARAREMCLVRSRRCGHARPFAGGKRLRLHAMRVKPRHRSAATIVAREEEAGHGAGSRHRRT